MLNRTRARRRAGGWTPQLNTWVSPLICSLTHFAFAPPFQAYTPLLTAFLATLLKLRDELLPPNTLLGPPSLHLLLPNITRLTSFSFDLVQALPGVAGKAEVSTHFFVSFSSLPSPLLPRSSPPISSSAKSVPCL